MTETSMAVQLAAAQLEAYNVKDIEAFVRCYAFPIEITNFPDESPVLWSEADFRRRYSDFFTREPLVHCEVEQRLAYGDFAIDKERLTGFQDGVSRQAVAMYEVRDHLIRRIWFIQRTARDLPT